MCIHVCVLVTQLCLTLVAPWTVAHQAPLCMEVSRQEYWSGLPFPSPGIFPTQVSCISGRLFTTWGTWDTPIYICTHIYLYVYTSHIFICIYMCRTSVYLCLCVPVCMCVYIHMHGCTQACYIFIWVSLGHLQHIYATHSPHKWN